MSTPSLDQLQGGLLGLLVGDAIGVPFEFLSTEQLQEINPKMFALPFTGDERSHPRAPDGAWSDDGAQALALLDSLLRNNDFVLNDFAQSLMAWKQTGKYAVNKVVFDIGIQTKQALNRIAQGVDPLDAGGAQEVHNGNGSLMRVLPLALWHQGSDKDLVDCAHDQSLPTHAHLRSQVACALVCLWARQLLNGSDDGFDEALNQLTSIYQSSDDQDSLHELSIIMEAANKTPQGTAYVVDTLWSVRQAFVQGASYEEVIQRAVATGPDTDTVAAIAGGLAGIKFGKEGIPQVWLDHLATDQSLLECLDGLKQLAVTPSKSFKHS